MHSRLIILLSLLGFSVLIAGVSFWCISKWQATPVPHPMMAPMKPAPMLPVNEPGKIPGVPEAYSKPPRPEAKPINIEDVCKNALAYMEFETGASADAFVERCKAGKHPEVIEQYKANLNLSDAVAI